MALKLPIIPSLLTYPSNKTLERMLFYQAIELPGIGLMKGCWDHRASVDPYLGRISFKNLTVVDIGLANGFWSFEMEKRGASRVIGLELGPRDRWDAVPHNGRVSRTLKHQLAINVQKTVNAFNYSRKILKSKVKLRRGSVYNAKNVVPKSDVVLLGNVLTHFRDPLHAIQSAASIAKHHLIISEALWYREPGFEREAAMRLVPRHCIPEVNHSWWQVTPSLVAEFLLILGFELTYYEEHDQLFCYSDNDQSSRQIPHFTYLATRNK